MIDKSGPTRAGWEISLETLISVSMENSNLTGRQKEYITKHYGLHGAVPMSLEALAKDRKITVNRVRQVLSQGLRRLDHHHHEDFQFYRDNCSDTLTNLILAVNITGT